MGTRGLAAVASGVIAVAATPLAQAERREGEAVAPALELALAVPVRFGEIVLPARRYRLSIIPPNLALADPATMLLIATVPATQSTSEATVSPARVELLERKGRVDIVVRRQDQVFVASGVKAQPNEGRERAQVELAAKSETQLGAEAPEEQSDRTAVQGVLGRYLKGVSHCGETARRLHWTTDDPHFATCVCPIASRWRMPRVKQALRVHQTFELERAGLSFTVTPLGTVTACRVWVGPKSPEEREPPSVTPLPAAAPLPVPMPAGEATP